MAEGPKRPSLGEEEQCRVEQSSFDWYWFEWYIWVHHISDTLHHQIGLVPSYFNIYLIFFVLNQSLNWCRVVFLKTRFSCCHKEMQMSETSCETNTEGKQRHLVGNLAQWSWTANSINISLLACLISYVDVILNTQSWTHLWLNISYIMFVK